MLVLGLLVKKIWLMSLLKILWPVGLDLDPHECGTQILPAACTARGYQAVHFCVSRKRCVPEHIPRVFLNTLVFPYRTYTVILCQQYTFCIAIYSRDFETPTFAVIFPGLFCNMLLAPPLCYISSFHCNCTETT